MKKYKIKYKGINYELKKYDYKNIKEGKKLFYLKNDNMEIIKIIKIYPGCPAPPDSYLIKIIKSKNKERIEREINIPHKSNKLFEII